MKVLFGKFLRAQARYRDYAISPQVRVTSYRNRDSRHTLILCPVSHVASPDFYRRLDQRIEGADTILSADYQTASGMVTLVRILDYTDLAQKTGLASQLIRSDASNARVADMAIIPIWSRLFLL